MKKIIVRVLVALVILVILAGVAVALFLDTAIKRGIETAGPMLAKVEVKLDSVNLSLLSGSGKLKGLFVGNPQGFKTASAIQVATASLALEPRSLFSDKVVIRSIDLEGPEITFETDLKKNNLNQILDNLQDSTGGENAPPKPNEPAPVQQAKATKKLQVDDFLIRGGKVHVSVTGLGGREMSVALPEIHLTALGQGPEGITPAELAKEVLQAVEKEAAQASSASVADLSKQATGLLKGVTPGSNSAVDNISKGIGGLFKKK